MIIKTKVSELEGWSAGDFICYWCDKVIPAAQIVRWEDTDTDYEEGQGYETDNGNGLYGETFPGLEEWDTATCFCSDECFIKQRQEDYAESLSEWIDEGGIKD